MVYLTIDLRGKVIANDTTITMTMLQSMDGITYYAVDSGSIMHSKTAFSTTLAKAATTKYISGEENNVYFDGKYLKLMFIAKTKTGFKKILSGYAKFNVR
jgi:hypothetical protein